MPTACKETRPERCPVLSGTSLNAVRTCAQAGTLTLCLHVWLQWDKMRLAIKFPTKAYINHANFTSPYGVLEQLLVTNRFRISMSSYGTRRPITIFIKAHDKTSSTSSHIIFYMIPPSTSRSPKWHISSRYPGKSYVGLQNISYACYMLYRLILLDTITLLIFSEEYKSWSSLMVSSFPPPPTFFLLGLNILLSSLFSDTPNTPNLCFSFKIRNQVSYPHKRTGDFTILHT